MNLIAYSAMPRAWFVFLGSVSTLEEVKGIPCFIVERQRAKVLDIKVVACMTRAVDGIFKGRREKNGIVTASTLRQ